MSIVNLSNNTVTAEILTVSFDPAPVAIPNGSELLYDHMLSGNGTRGLRLLSIDAEKWTCWGGTWVTRPANAASNARTKRRGRRPLT